FIHEPKLALIDEPLVNFDPIMQQKVKSFFVSYVKDGNTLFYSTHMLEIAEEICTEVAILQKGNLLYTGRIDEIKAQGEDLSAFFLSQVRSPQHG
ncbi:MAG: ABC transporter ATP-binding protein, partial [Methanospirillum sp.]|nr:ABC transporter ATP-binding protein [Methanospirillum sp.]